METSKYTMSIDVGTTKIAAIVGRVDKYGKVIIKASHAVKSRGIRRGMIENVEEGSRAIQECLWGLAKQWDISQIKEVNVGIAGHHINCLQSSISDMRSNHSEPITAKEMELLLARIRNMAVPDGEQILHVIPQQYIIDGLIARNPVGNMGNHILVNFLVVTGKKVAINAIRTCVQRCGLQLKGLVLEPLASAEATLTKEEREEGVVLVDIGGGTSDMIIIYNDMVVGTTVIPFGGEVLTEDLRQLCNISYAKAEYIKKKYGACYCPPEHTDRMVVLPATEGNNSSSLRYQTLSDIIKARMEEILEAVGYQMEQSGYGQRIKTVVLTGGGSLVAYLSQLVNLKTGIHARLGVPYVRFENEDVDKKLSPAFATSVGLVQQAQQDDKDTATPSKFSIWVWTRGGKTLSNLLHKIDKAIFKDDDIPMDQNN